MKDLLTRAATEQDMPAILDVYRKAQIDGENGFTVEEALAPFNMLKSYPSFRVFLALVASLLWALMSW